MLFDEDLYLNPDYVRELGKLLRSERDTWGVKYFSFGSINSLSQFTPEELRDCGCGAIWIGVESFLCGANLTDDHYAKRKGKEIKEMFEGLQQYGIQTTGSLVLGFDFHTRENLKEDIDRFVALKPTMYQLSPLLPCPGTALYERMLEEDRILDSYKWEDLHLWSGDVYKPKNFKKDEIKEYFDYAHDQIRDTLGPPPLQLMESAMNAHRVFKDATDEFHLNHAKRFRGMASGVYAYLRSVKKYHTSEKVRARARMLEKRYHDEIGDAPLLSRIASLYLSRAIRKNAEKPRGTAISDPPPRWSYYNTFDDKVWVRKGRKAKKPAPYKDRRSLISIARFIRGSG